MPSFLSCWIASAVESLIGSDTATKPANCPSAATYITVCPSACRASALARKVSAEAPISLMSAALPIATFFPWIVPVTPFPVTDWNPSTANNSTFFSWAAARMAAASGCSLAFSRLAVSWRRLASSKPSAETSAVSTGLPTVSVPVLSTTSVLTFSSISRASASRIRMPSPAPRPAPTMIAIGVASPRAHGHAMMSTATALTRAWA